MSQAATTPTPAHPGEGRGPSGADDYAALAPETPIGRLLAAAAALTQAANGIIENARAPKLFAADVALYADNQDAIHPLGDELDAIADALTNLHPALGEPASTLRLANAAEAWIRGED